MEKQKFVIGLIGEIGSGKGEFTDFLRLLSPIPVGRLRFSDPLGDVLKRLYLPAERENYQILGDGLRTFFGPQVVADVVRGDITHASESVLVLDGARYPDDVEMVSAQPNHLLVYVTADPLNRFSRDRDRREKAGEEILDYTRFNILDHAPTEVQIPAIGKKADLRIVNNGTLDEYHGEISRLWENQLRTQLSLLGLLPQNSEPKGSNC